MHAAIALASMSHIDEHLERRRSLAARYSDGILAIPGVRTQAVDSEDLSTYKDFTIAIDSRDFGVSRDQLVTALSAEGIDTRNYFDPPVHRQDSHASRSPSVLPVTDAVSKTVVSLPLYPALSDAVVDQIVEIIATVGKSAASLN
jgi:dTDP-4-amino-4,6-dideoxygalactose transaminase